MRHFELYLLGTISMLTILNTVFIFKNKILDALVKRKGWGKG